MSGGGFVVDESSANGSGSGSGLVQHPSAATDGVAQADQPLLSLTPRQENRLRAHVDDKLLGLERDDRKGSFGSLPQLIGRIYPLLQLILQIPALDPFGALRISYFLTLTGAIPSYIASQRLLSPPEALQFIPQQLLEANGTSSVAERERSVTPLLPVKLEEGIRSPDTVSEVSTGLARLELDPAQIASQTLLALLALLNLADKGWQAVLRGEGWVMDTSGRGHGVPVRFGSQVGATERIRLRSILLTGREKMIAWARAYGDFPASGLPTADRDEGSGTTPSASNGQTGDPAGSEGRDWEAEVMSLFNGTLEMLSDMNFTEADGPVR